MIRKNNLINLGFLFIISPWLAWLFNFSNIRNKSFGYIYISFAILFGLSFSFKDSGADSFRYAQAFSNFDNTLNLKKIFELYSDGELRDLYRLLLFYLTSLFSNSPKLLYAMAGMIYGFFSYKNLLIFSEFKIHGSKLNSILSFLLFYSLVSLTNINGFRFWTGAMILFYASYNFFMNHKSGFIFLILICPIFHYSFVLFIPLLLIFRLILNFLQRDNFNLFFSVNFVFFIVSFFTSFFIEKNPLSLNFITDGEYISGEIGQRINYLNSAEISQMVEVRRQDSFFLNTQSYFDLIIKIVSFFILFQLYMDIYLKKIYINDSLKYFLFFTMYLFGVTYWVSLFTGGYRFYFMPHMFFVIFMSFIINKSAFSVKYSYLFVFLFLSFSFNILFYNFLMPFFILDSGFWFQNLFWRIIDCIFYNFNF